MATDIHQNHIFDTVKHRIVHLNYRPHQRLTEIKLSQEFGCSRTPVREALRKLEQEGWVTMIPHQGYYIRSYTSKEVEDLYEVLITLEKMAVRLAIEQGNDEKLAVLNEVWVNKPVSWEETIGLQMITDDEEFHEQIALASGNGELFSHIKKINERIHIIRRIDYNQKDWASSIVTDHVEIMKQIMDKNVDQAEMLIEKHIRSNKENMKQIIQLYFQETTAFE
ncbi:GntR family transcriptional regulator [Paenibacillus solisilvae]|uniref:GntR family transcriptional regulator n=1 Tax=Paenibacillus solisilvae TaxID=2486751 RepID=A0ABW0W0F8_9BACL